MYVKLCAFDFLAYRVDYGKLLTNLFCFSRAPPFVHEFVERCQRAPPSALAAAEETRSWMQWHAQVALPNPLPLFPTSSIALGITPVEPSKKLCSCSGDDDIPEELDEGSCKDDAATHTCAEDRIARSYERTLIPVRRVGAQQVLAAPRIAAVSSSPPAAASFPPGRRFIWAATQSLVGQSGIAMPPSVQQSAALPQRSWHAQSARIADIPVPRPIHPMTIIVALVCFASVLLFSCHTVGRKSNPQAEASEGTVSLMTAAELLANCDASNGIYFDSNALCNLHACDAVATQFLKQTWTCQRIIPKYDLLYDLLGHCAHNSAADNTTTCPLP